MLKKIILFSLIIIATSCGTKVYLTEEQRDNLENKGLSLEDIQYYNSKKIILKRIMKEGKTSVETGKVKVEDGQLVHFIIIKKNTPGIVVETDENILTTKFEKEDMRELVFKVVPCKTKQNVYTITADEWKNREGRLVYDNQEYFIQPGGGDTKLMIRKKSLSKKKKIKRKVSGVKL